MNNNSNVTDNGNDGAFTKFASILWIATVLGGTIFVNESCHYLALPGRNEEGILREYIFRGLHRGQSLPSSECRSYRHGHVQYNDDRDDDFFFQTAYIVSWLSVGFGSLVWVGSITIYYFAPCLFWTPTLIKLPTSFLKRILGLLAILTASGQGLTHLMGFSYLCQYDNNDRDNDTGETIFFESCQLAIASHVAWVTMAGWIVVAIVLIRYPSSSSFNNVATNSVPDSSSVWSSSQSNTGDGRGALSIWSNSTDAAAAALPPPDVLGDVLGSDAGSISLDNTTITTIPTVTPTSNNNENNNNTHRETRDSTIV